MSTKLTTIPFNNSTSVTTSMPNTSNVSQDAGSIVNAKWFIALKYTLYSIIFLISLVGNSLVCFVVSRRMKLKTVTNYFIMNLAVADLLYTLCIPFDVIVTVMQVWPYGPVMCRILYPLQTVTITVSVFTLTALSVTRHWAVVYPLRRQITVKHSFIVIMLLWPIAAVTVIPYIIQLKHNLATNRCEEAEWSELKHRQVYTVSLFVIQYALPLSVIATCYIKIGLELTKGPTTYNKTLAKARGREAKRVIRMLLIVTLTFAILTLPSAIMWMWLDFGNADKVFTSFWDLMAVLNIFDFLNSASNPVIYSFCNERFSREFRRHLSCNLVNTPSSESEIAKFTAMEAGSSSSSPQVSLKKKKVNQSDENDTTLV